MRHWTAEEDTLTDKPGKHLTWTDASKGQFPYPHQRPLPVDTAQKALDYISSIVRRYPFQIRYSMSMPLWYRFCDKWCESGDEKESLLAI